MYRQQSLTLADLAGCLVLSEEAGWNQTAADWRLILERGEGFGLRRTDGSLVATAMTLPYGHFAWVCMVLVAVTERGQGHATRLLTACLQTLGQRGLIAGLDATPAGRVVYLKLGFHDVYPLTRMQAAEPRPVPVAAEPGLTVQPLTVVELPGVLALDADVFGGDRSPVIQALLRRQPAAAHVALAGNRIAGYVLARDGRQATQVGPVVADRPAVAQALIDAALAAIGGPAFIDVPDAQTAVRGWLESGGFTPQRPLVRMLAGRCRSLDQPDRIFAIAGPELA